MVLIVSACVFLGNEAAQSDLDHSRSYEGRKKKRRVNQAVTKRPSCLRNRHLALSN